jgi:dihydroorotate dehydrogenase electron transfer subunit
MPIVRNARLRDIRNWDDHVLLSIDAPEVGREARPGQFVMIKVTDGLIPLLRRPLSIHDAGKDGIELFFKVAGQGTGILARKKSGDPLDLIGPLGKGFTISDGMKGKRAFCVGGGRGIAPLYFLARELDAAGARPTVLYGGRRLADIPLREKFERAGIELLCSTEDGSFGFKGLVTELVGRELAGAKPDIVYACGPDAMMKILAALAAKHGLPSELSLESVMGCGIGACWGCVHRIRNENGDGWTKICEDGPVFPGERVLWPE